MIKIVEVKPKSDYTLFLTFSDGKSGFFDAKPYLDKGAFSDLKDMRLFNSVKISDATVEWQNGVDLCPECIYDETVFL